MDEPTEPAEARSPYRDGFYLELKGPNAGLIAILSLTWGVAMLCLVGVLVGLVLAKIGK